MEPTTFISLSNYFKKFIFWTFEKFGYKIVKKDDYNDEILEVSLNYPNESPQAIQAKNNGAKFFWSEKYNQGYEKYSEIDGNKRRFFRCRNQFLWIKKGQQ